MSKAITILALLCSGFVAQAQGRSLFFINEDGGSLFVANLNYTFHVSNKDIQIYGNGVEDIPVVLSGEAAKDIYLYELAFSHVVDPQGYAFEVDGNSVGKISFDIGVIYSQSVVCVSYFAKDFHCSFLWSKSLHTITPRFVNKPRPRMGTGNSRVMIEFLRKSYPTELDKLLDFYKN